MPFECVAQGGRCRWPLTPAELLAGLDHSGGARAQGVTIRHGRWYVVGSDNACLEVGRAARARCARDEPATASARWHGRARS